MPSLFPFFLGSLIDVVYNARYAYSDGKGEDSDDEETESLCKGSPRGDIGLVKMEKKEGVETSDGEDEPEDGKRE